MTEPTGNMAVSTGSVTASPVAQLPPFALPFSPLLQLSPHAAGLVLSPTPNAGVPGATLPGLDDWSPTNMLLPPLSPFVATELTTSDVVGMDLDWNFDLPPSPVATSDGGNSAHPPSAAQFSEHTGAALQSFGLFAAPVPEDKWYYTSDAFQEYLTTLKKTCERHRKEIQNASVAFQLAASLILQCDELLCYTSVHLMIAGAPLTRLQDDVNQYQSLVTENPSLANLPRLPNKPSMEESGLQSNFFDF